MFTLALISLVFFASLAVQMLGIRDVALSFSFTLAKEIHNSQIDSGRRSMLILNQEFSRRVLNKVSSYVHAYRNYIILLNNV